MMKHWALLDMHARVDLPGKVALVKDIISEKLFLSTYIGSLFTNTIAIATH
jgi:hypothetical protein